MNVREVRTLMTLEAKNFEKELKGIDKIVDNVTNNFKKTQKEVKALEKDLVAVNKEFAKLDKSKTSLKEIDTNMQKLTGSTKKLVNELKQVDTAAKMVKTHLKEATKVDLSSIGKLNTLLQSMKSVKLLNKTDFDNALMSVRRISNELKNMKVDVDTTSLRKKLNNLSASINMSVNASTRTSETEPSNPNRGLRHWLDNKQGGSSDSDDMSRTLQKILLVMNKQVDALTKNSVFNSMNKSLIEINTNIKKQLEKMNIQMNAQRLSLYKDYMYQTNPRKIIDVRAMGEAITRQLHSNTDSKYRIDDMHSSTGGNPRYKDANQTIYDKLYSNANQSDNGEIKVISSNVSKVKGILQGIYDTLKKFHTEITRQSTDAVSKTRTIGFGNRNNDTTRSAIHMSEDEFNNLNLGNASVNNASTPPSSDSNTTINVIRSILEELREMHKVLIRLSNTRVNGSGGSSNGTPRVARAGDNDFIGPMPASPNLSVWQRVGKIFKDMQKDSAGKGFGDRMSMGLNALRETASTAGEELGLLSSAAGGGGKAVTGLGVAAGAAVAGIMLYVAAVKKAVDIMITAAKQSAEFQKAVAKFAANTGANQKQVGEFNKELTKGFTSQGYTESIEEYASSLTKIHIALGLTGDAAVEMNKKVLMASSSTGLDVNEIIRAQKNVMINLKLTAKDAIDLIYKSYQITGDLNGDLLDTYTEYSSQFQKLGLSAGYFLNILNVGSKAGVMNLDKVADTVKELGNKFSSIDDNGITAFNDLGLSYSKLKEGFQKGGKDSEKALNQVFNAVSKVTDKTKRNSIIATLFGSPGEDLGTKFFDMIANGQVKLEEFVGTTEDAQKAIEQTYSYTTTKIQNQITGLWDALGQDLVPLLTKIMTNLDENMEHIKDVIHDTLAPAFYELANTIAYALGLDKPDDFAGGLEVIIKVITGIIKAVSFFTLAFSKSITICKILVKGFYSGLLVLGMGLTKLVQAAADTIIGIADLILKAFSGVAYIFEGLVRSIDDVLIILGKGFLNIGAVITNVFTWAAKKSYNALVDLLINPFIDLYNATIGTLPGASKIDRRGFTTQELNENKPYISIGNQLDGLKRAWTTDNYSAQFIIEEDKVVKKMKSVTQGLADQAINYLGDKFVDNGNKLIDDFKDLATSVPDFTVKLPDRIKVPDKPDDGKGNGNPTSTSTDQFNGKDPTKAGDDAAKKAEEDAKKAEEERLKAKNDYFKRLIDFEKRAQADAIKFEEEAAQKRWNMMGDTKEMYQDQIDFYEKLKNKYILTSDEIIAYTQKQYDAGKRMQEVALKDFKTGLDKEVKAQTDSNNKKITEYQNYLDTIDRKLTNMQDKWSADDLQSEIDRLKKQLGIYKNARSYEGIKKRQEIETELAAKLLEQSRNNEQKKLEAEKTGYEDKIKELEKANNDISTKYEALYTDLESVATNKEKALGKIREDYTNETNDNIKKSLDQLKIDYSKAYEEMDKATVTAIQNQNNRIIDAKRSWSEGDLTGEPTQQEDATWLAADARNKGGTIPSTQALDNSQNFGRSGSPDYQRFTWLGNEWTRLEALKKTASPEQADQYSQLQNTYHMEADTLRKKYGVGAMQPIPMTPKFHKGGLVQGMKDKFGEITAKLKPGEAVLTSNAFSRLMSFIDNLSPNMMNPAMAGVPSSVNSTNISIGSVVNNSNADSKRFFNELNVMTTGRNRANGSRKV